MSRSNGTAARPLIVMTLLVVGGCASVPDKRLVEDQQSCRSMGHVAESASFKQCMSDLNNRRCAVEGPKRALVHMKTEYCTQL